MNKKLILVLAAAVIMLLIGSIPSSYETGFEDTFGDEMISVHVKGSASLVDPEGNVVSSPTINPGQLIDPSGTPVQTFQLDLAWDALGDQIDWDTFSVMVNRKMVVYNRAGQGNLKVPLGTSIYKNQSATFQESVDLEQKIVNGLSVETLNSWGGIRVNYTFTIMATAQSVYNESLSTNVTKVVIFDLDWDPADLDLEVDSPAESTGQTEEETYQTSPIAVDKDTYALSTVGGTSSKLTLMSTGLILTAAMTYLILRKRGH